MRKVIWHLPHIIALAIAGLVAAFSSDGYFTLLALVTIVVFAIIVHWAWTEYIGEQAWYDNRIDDNTQSERSGSEIH